MATTRHSTAHHKTGADGKRVHVREVYETIAGEYDRRIPGNGPSDEVFTDTELDFLLEKIQHTDQVLDMGCGTGRFTVPLAEHAAKVTGLDISPHMLTVNCSKLLERGLEAHLVEGDMTALPFPDDSFDAVTSMLALMHIPLEDRQRVFTEAARVLRGGRLLIGVKNAVFERLFAGDRFADVDITDASRPENSSSPGPAQARASPRPGIASARMTCRG